VKIYVCDRCGARHQITNGIVGSEFDLHGFGTLSERFGTPGIVDVCEACMDVARTELDAVRNKLAGTEDKRVRRKLSGRREPDRPREPNFVDRWTKIIKNL
jgi:hypothetical protein